MKVLHINSLAHRGGAGRAMLRLHHGLNRAGHDSRVLTRSDDTSEPRLFTMEQVVSLGMPRLERLIRALAPRLDRSFGIPDLHISTRLLLKADIFRQADVIHLHNLHGWYFNYPLLPQISAAKPVIWTLHDMWALTGHCAYSYECTRWQTGCYSCPLLRPANRALVEPGTTRVDCTRWIWARKKRLYEKSSLNIATPSRWLHRIVSSSILAQAQNIEFIPNGVDLDVFRPRDQAEARSRLGIPADAPVILFVAEKLGKKRKEFELLLRALEHVADRESLVLLTFGAPEGKDRLGRFSYKELGQLFDEERQALAYNAADLFVFPTLADNQPLVVLESLACGTPIVSFDVGGVPEMVRHMETGYLADYRDVEHLARGIDTLLDNPESTRQMRLKCREVAVAEYGLERQVTRYTSLYTRAIRAHGGSGSPLGL